MKLSKPFLVAATAAALSVASLSGASFAAQSDQPERHGMSAEDRAALLDARVAALRAGLKLTPDQEKNWAPLEAAIREQAKERAERFAAWREKRESQDEHHDLIERLQMRSQWMTVIAHPRLVLRDRCGELTQGLERGGARAANLNPRVHVQRTRPFVALA